MRAVAAPSLAIPPLAGSALPLFGVPEWAPRRPSRRGALGIGRTGWLAAAAFHAVLAAVLLIGLPRMAPEPWPEDATFVELVFEPPPAPKAPAPVEPAAPKAAETPPPNVADMLPPIEAPPPVETAEIPPEPAPSEPAEPAPLLAAPLPPPEPAPAVASAEPVPAPIPLPRPKPAHAALLRPARPAAAPRPAPADAAPTSPAPASPEPRATAPQTAMLPIVPPQPVGFAAGNRRPDYPADARRRGWQGQVVLRVEVSADGRPETAAVLTSSGHKSLDEAALAAVRLWRFRPAVQGGVPVAAPADVPVRFRLED